MAGYIVGGQNSYMEASWMNEVAGYALCSKEKSWGGGKETLNSKTPKNGGSAGCVDLYVDFVFRPGVLASSGRALSNSRKPRLVNPRPEILILESPVPGFKYFHHCIDYLLPLGVGSKVASQYTIHITISRYEVHSRYILVPGTWHISSQRSKLKY